jgi:hypothetical protein
MSRFSYRRRTFLTPPSTGFTSYVLAEVESSDGGGHQCGRNMLTLADCRRRIELEFCLTTALERRRSLAKVELLLEVLTAFRDALAAEAQLIAGRDREKEGRHAGKRKTKGGRVAGALRKSPPILIAEGNNDGAGAAQGNLVLGEWRACPSSPRPLIPAN